VTARLRRALALVLAALALALSALVAGAGIADAHAVLESTTPEQGSELTAAPTSVTLTFGEDVTVGPRSLAVINSAGDRVDDAHVTHPGGRGDAVAIGLRSGLPKGSYSVVWRVVSADSHPVSGVFSYGYGVPPGAATDVRFATDLATAVAHGTFRAIGYAGLLVLLGTAFFIAVLWTGEPAAGAVRRVLQVSWLATAVGALGVLVLQGPYAAGVGLGSLTDPSLLSETVGTRYGKLTLARLVVLGLLVPVLRRLGRDRSSRADLAGLAVALVLTDSLAGHAGTSSPAAVSVINDAVHLLAVSVWLGGLVVLVTALLRASRAAELAVVLPRWSRTAVVSVAVLTVTGTYASWREVGTLPALWGTTYGLVLVAKVAGVALMVGLGYLGHRWVRRHTPAPRLVAYAAMTLDVPRPSRQEMPPPPPEAIRLLRRSVVAETVLAVGVVALAATLVNEQPAREAYVASYDATLTATDVSGQHITVVIDVPRTSTGGETLHAYTYDSAGRVLPVATIDGQLDEPTQDLPAVRFTFADTGAGHGTADGVVVPLQGTWRLTVQVHTNGGDVYGGTTSYAVHG